MPRDPGLREPLSADGRAIRVDLQHIADMVAPGSRVLDVGCGDGALLDYLVHFKQVDGRGIELSQAGVNACVGVGLSVIQGDADTDLAGYPSDAFDYAILSQTLQATRDPKGVLDQLVRIARRAIVSFPNFGHWRMRWHLLTQGTMPVTPSLPAAVVRDAQHPSLHHPRFPAVLRRGRHRHRAGDRHRQPRPRLAHPLLPLGQSLRRAGTVLAQSGLAVRRKGSLSLPSWSAKADHPRVCLPQAANSGR